MKKASKIITWWSASCYHDHILNLLEEQLVYVVVASLVNNLTKKLVRRLRPIRLQHWHVQIVNLHKQCIGAELHNIIVL